ncbi:hypothetical protein [Rathayibacter tanaceti]|uniref:Uncharacterized protein n=2 Tax=Rathayibacter tanaceti TaxID=1671680 RepID=A0A162GHR4_9MICO|nr:hypothetical protein [Rathayibacter tanaceti]KZX21359.1 hypothetical protein ACH61_01501 [Rathayibacter tanaceti]QHC54388.1 hypothetical protein GSU10_01045 [Rathayibacter tanaceti]TCO38072.1 hypothetical protein EV639_103259 [Rathayibacter tanaceti]
MSSTTAESLIAGYRSYAVQAPDLSGTTEAAPAATPGVLSFIAASTVACGTAISVVGGSVVGTTVNAGC